MYKITSSDALLIIDMQPDFLPGGPLAVPGADMLLPVINRLSRLPFGLVVASQDWHPQDHVSFVTRSGPWPVHCVADTPGAALSPHLEQKRIGVIMRKGMDPDVDSYSAFGDNNGTTRTGLAGLLESRGMTRVFITGVALDYCVACTARDARRAGFNTIVLHDACLGVAAAPDTVFSALAADGITSASSPDLQPG
ncbi:nicotinamidase [Komagataeibacter sp. FNDCF1]|uniref:nicotinamidase n=1 Tax=Komagataeibacter sp. FNDCF1 TaxID=2878681 RepID=UPI001E504BE7|nr:nicotinamidase [Komagataeibacter sp. FNDCF1]MCE2563166.1 nicotinamidase [Komagataeibacter sp. FNDCF1]